MNDTERKSIMVTYTGVRFDPFNPNPSSINIEDVAHSLSMQCRYAGHVRRYFSVAEHSVMVSDFAPDHLKLEALLHDAAEAYAQDMVAPVKNRLGDYGVMIEKIETAVRAHFRLPFQETPLVHEIDQWVGKYERCVITKHHHDDPTYATHFVEIFMSWLREHNLPVFACTFRCLSPQQAESEFLDTYYRLLAAGRKEN